MEVYFSIVRLSSVGSSQGKCKERLGKEKIAYISHRVYIIVSLQIVIPGTPMHHYNLKVSLAQPSNLEGTPAFAFPGRIRTLDTPNPDLSRPILRIPKLSSKVPSVKVAELGEALGLFLDPRLSLRTGISAPEALSAG